MKTWKIVLKTLSMAFMLTVATTGLCATSSIKENSQDKIASSHESFVSGVKPSLVAAYDEVTIFGKNFDKENVTVAITELDEEEKPQGKPIIIKPLNSENTTITFKMPKFLVENNTKFAVSVVNFEAKQSNEVKLTYYVGSINSYIKDAVKWKKNGESASAILDHLSVVIERDINEGIAPSTLFSGISIKGNDLEALKEAGFDSEFISTLEGKYQYATIGLAAIFLPDSGKVTTSPMLRVFLTPKSYFSPRFPLFTTSPFIISQSKTSSIAEWLSSIRKSIDFNVGYTIVSAKTGDSENKTNYFLTGLSYEMNRSVLMNCGAAFPVNGGSDNKITYYVGITVDQNLLKGIGLIK